MASPRISTMREKIASLYPGIGWKYRCFNQMSNNQVIAIYKRSEEKGLFDKNRKKVEIEGRQLTIFEFLPPSERNKL